MSDDHHGWKPMVQVIREAKAHMVDLPLPSGSWQENHNKINQKWNIQLGVNLVLFVGTWAYVSE